MNNKQIADTIITIVKDLNVFVRAANRKNLLVDSNLGQLTGMLQVAVLEYQPAIASTGADDTYFDDVEKRAEALVNDGFNEVDHSKLQILDDESAKQSIIEALSDMPENAGGHA